MTMATAQGRTTRTLVIDASPRGPGGAFADESLQGRSVLDHLVGVAQSITKNDPALRWVVLPEGSPPADAVVLRTDRLYDLNRLRRAIRRGNDPETAVFWRLDRPGGLDGAEDELRRRQSYQPLGKYWALDPARWIAKQLCPTRIRPNAVTIAASIFMFGASGIVAFAGSSLVGNLLAALGMALALILDTADGHLARLQETASDFGRHLDAWLDELCDMVLHAAIAWGAYARTGQSGWLLAGMAYAMGKYVFYVGTSVSSTSNNEANANSPFERPTILRQTVRMAGHADLRWHLWIVLAALGRLDAALVAYAIYFPVRAILGLAGRAKEVRHA